MALSNFYWVASSPIDGLLISDIPQAMRYLNTNTIALLTPDHYLPSAELSSPGVDFGKLNRSCTFTIEKGSGWNSLAIPIFRCLSDRAITIVSAEFAVIGTSTPTLTFNIEERPATTLNSAGTDIKTADMVADADGLSVSTWDNASIAAKACLVFTTAASAAESGTVDLITGTIYYR